MVKHHYGFADPKKLRAFGDAWLIYVHHNKNRIISRIFHSLLAVNKHVPRIIFIFPEKIRHGFYGGACLIEHNVRSALQHSRNAVNAHRRPEAVRIRDPVPHDNHLILGGNDLPKRLGLYSRLYSGVLFHLLALPAKIDGIVRRLDYRLVSTPSKGQINGISRKFIILRIGEAVKTDPNADRHRHLISNINRLHIAEQVKLVFLQKGNRLFAENNHIFVFLDLFADPVIGRNIFVYLSLNQGCEKGAPYLLHAL